MKLKQRHDRANKQLQKLSAKYSNKETSDRLAKLFGVSNQTILNYLHGMGKDGFLKDCIIHELTELETTKTK